MKADLYTKSVMTVIAACLCIIVVRDITIVPVAEAQIGRNEGVVRVQIVSFDESPTLSWEAIPVRVEGEVEIDDPIRIQDPITVRGTVDCD